MEIVLKVIIIGPTGVGKSTLMNKMMEKEISYQNMPSTIGVDFGVINENNIKIQFWDTAGQERFASIVNLYFKNVNFVLLVYDLSNKNNIENLKYYLNLCKEKCNESPILIIGNKADQKDIYPASLDKSIINEFNIIGHLKISCNDESLDYLMVKNYLLNYVKDINENKERILEYKTVKLLNNNKTRYKCCGLF